MTESQKKQGTCITAAMKKDREEPDWYPDGFTFKEKYEEAKKEIESLKKELAQAKEDHQYDNLVHKQEVDKLGK